MTMNRVWLWAAGCSLMLGMSAFGQGSATKADPTEELRMLAARLQIEQTALRQQLEKLRAGLAQLSATVGAGGEGAALSAQQQSQLATLAAKVKMFEGQAASINKAIAAGLDRSAVAESISKVEAEIRGLKKEIGALEAQAAPPKDLSTLVAQLSQRVEKLEAVPDSPSPRSRASSAENSPPSAAELGAQGALASVAVGAPASDATADASPSAAPAEKPWYDRVKLEGVVDAYYGYRLNASSAAIRAPSELRAFDGNNHAFTLAYAELALSVPAEPVGLRIDLGFGTVADATATDLSSPPSMAQEVFKHLQQAYATFKLFDTVTVDAGKFVTSAGAEVIEAKDNWLYSRSLLFTWAIPFAHTGLRVGVPFSDTFSATLQIVNGWDSQLSALTFKTFGLTAAFNPSPATSIALNFYGGPVNTPNIRLLFDLLVTQYFGDAFAINLNGDFGTEANNSWYGAALMGKLMVSENVRLAARLEYFADPAGVRTAVVATSGTGGPSFVSVTAGAALGFSGLVKGEIRPELRVDWALDAVPFVGGTDATQVTGQVGFLAWF